MMLSIQKKPHISDLYLSFLFIVVDKTIASINCYQVTGHITDTTVAGQVTVTMATDQITLTIITDQITDSMVRIDQVEETSNMKLMSLDGVFRMVGRWGGALLAKPV